MLICRFHFVSAKFEIWVTSLELLTARFHNFLIRILRCKVGKCYYRNECACITCSTWNYFDILRVTAGVIGPWCFFYIYNGNSSPRAARAVTRDLYACACCAFNYSACVYLNNSSRRPAFSIRELILLCWYLASRSHAFDFSWESAISIATCYQEKSSMIFSFILRSRQMKRYTVF